MERERYLGEGRGLRPDAAVMAYDGGAREWTAGGGQGRGRTVAAGGGQARGRGSFFLEILRSRGCAGEAMAVRDARCAGGGDGRLTRGKARRKSSLSFILFRCRDLPILKF
jgi:hypothetical protein